ncbi:MAG: WD40 repeat domain-containing protein, partial [Treponema sp.]|nr:WD40 repeat domain-containing protein [Treponema sp.]
MSFLEIDGKYDDDYIADLDRRIEEAKEKEKKQIDPTTCYPRITFKLLTEESYSGTTNIEFEMNYFIDSENGMDFRGEFGSGYLDTREKKAELCAKFIEAFYPYISGNTQKKEYSAPEIIDQRTITEPDGSKNQSYINVAVRDDYSFIMRTKSSIADYSPTWDIKENLTKKIQGNTNYSTFWVPYTPDGKSILFANQSSPTVIGINEKNTITSRVQYKFPASSYTSLSFLSSGNPFLVDQANFKIYFPQKNGEKLPYMTYPVSIIYAIASGPDDTICFHVDNSVLFYNTKTYSLEKVVLLEYEESGVSLLKILKDGSFITVNRNECYISRFTGEGKHMWDLPFSDSLKYSIYAGGGNGMYFLYDTLSNVCWRIAEANADLPPVLVALKNSSGKIHEASLKETAEIYKKNAYTLYEAGSYSAALENFTKYLEISPLDTDAADKKLLCEVAINKKLAEDKTNEALDLYDEYGAETARSAYQEAMKLLEKLRKQVP